ncbi:hypothetical protein ACFLTU_00400 [Bacteroidota bacterium]
MSLQLFFPPVQAQTRKVRQALHKKEQLDKKEQKQYEDRRKATLKHRYEIQTKEVQERMKQTERRSRKYGRKKKDPFLKNLFKGKKKRKKRRR